MPTIYFLGAVYNAVIGDDLTAEELERAHRRAKSGRLTSAGWVQNEEFIVLGKLFDISIVVYADDLNPLETHWTQLVGASSETCFVDLLTDLREKKNGKIMIINDPAQSKA